MWVSQEWARGRAWSPRHPAGHGLFELAPGWVAPSSTTPSAWMHLLTPQPVWEQEGGSARCVSPGLSHSQEKPREANRAWGKIELGGGEAGQGGEDVEKQNSSSERPGDWTGVGTGEPRLAASQGRIRKAQWQE